MKFDVHRIEQVRVKIADVEADSPAEALALTEAADMSAILDAECDVPLSAVGPRAYAASRAFHDAPPIQAMVEVASSHGEHGEHHFDFDRQTGKFVPAEADRPQHVERAGGSDRGSPEGCAKAFLCGLNFITGESSTNHKVLVVAMDKESAFEVLCDAAAGYWGEGDLAQGDEVAGYRHEGCPTVTRPADVHEIPSAVYLALKGHMLRYREDGVPEPLAIGDADSALLAPALPQVDAVLAESIAALDALAHEIGQMRGMFDDADGNTQAALDAGEAAGASISQLRQALGRIADQAQVEAQAQSGPGIDEPDESPNRPRGAADSPRGG